MLAPSTRTATGRSGLTLIELAVGITILLVGVLGFAQALVALEKAQARTREAGRAMQAARGMIERIQAEAFPEAFRRFNGDGAEYCGEVVEACKRQVIVDVSRRETPSRELPWTLEVAAPMHAFKASFALPFIR